MHTWPQVNTRTGEQLRVAYPAGVETDYQRAHRLLCEAAQAVAALRGAYANVEEVSELADKAFTLFEDTVGILVADAPRDPHECGRDVWQGPALPGLTVREVLL